MLATEIIKKKRNGQILTFSEIEFFIQGYTLERIPDYQMAALLMAILLNGMTPEETIDLTQVMLDSGTKLDFNTDPLAVDKHSTGGVGDKTSLILAPIVAACDVPVPMISGRGLGHTGGTLDKLESIPGFNINLSLKEFQEQVQSMGLSFIGQTADICPADKKIYSLRDVTATVESLPLICASIMSKKIAEGIRGLVLDVKVGSGAFMKRQEDAQNLARGLISIGKGHGIETQAILTNMNQPLGSYCGNALEIHECLSILKRQDFRGDSYQMFSDTEELSLSLASKMIAIAKNTSLPQARKEAVEALDSGRAFEKFDEVCREQGGDLKKVPLPSSSHEILATKDGFLSSLNSEAIGIAGISLGAGRKVVSDSVNPTPGIQIHKKLGQEVRTGEPLFTIHGDRQIRGQDEATALLQSCYEINGENVAVIPLIISEEI